MANYCHASCSQQQRRQQRACEWIIKFAISDNSAGKKRQGKKNLINLCPISDCNFIPTNLKLREGTLHSVVRRKEVRQTVSQMSVPPNCFIICFMVELFFYYVFVAITSWLCLSLSPPPLPPFVIHSPGSYNSFVRWKLEIIWRWRVLICNCFTRGADRKFVWGKWGKLDSVTRCC